MERRWKCMHLLHGEKPVYENQKLNLTVTSHRVRWHTEGHGYASLESLDVDSICAATFGRTSQPLWLWYSVPVWLLALSGIPDFLAGKEYTTWLFRLLPFEIPPMLLVVFSICAGMFLVSAWQKSIKSVLRIATAGHTLEIPSSGIKDDETERIIQAIEAAREAHRAMSTRQAAAPEQPSA